MTKTTWSDGRNWSQNYINLSFKPIREVFLGGGDYRPYNPCAPQQFRNTPLDVPTVLDNGKSIVDIGFVDFVISFDSIGSIDFKGEPVTVLGYDMDPFCVAKSMVMITMMKNSAVNA